MSIELKNISKVYKGKEVFNKFSYFFEKGKTYVILGDNGVGKSVLLKIICGFSVCDEGEVLIDNIPLGKEFDFIQNAGITINNPDFISYLSGLENLLMIASVKKICNKNDIMKWVKLFEMEDEINRSYKKYSLGTKQKLRLIQALMEDPEYLILDEPFNGLDKHIKKTFIDQIKNEQASNKTLFITSHYLEEVMKIDCEILELTHNHLEKIACVKDGKLIKLGEIND